MARLLSGVNGAPPQTGNVKEKGERVRANTSQAQRLVFDGPCRVGLEMITFPLIQGTEMRPPEEHDLWSPPVQRPAPGLPPKALQSLMQLVLLWPARSKGLLALQAPRFPLPSLPSVADFCIPERSLLFAQDLQSSSGLAKPLMLSGGWTTLSPRGLVCPSLGVSPLPLCLGYHIVFLISHSSSCILDNDSLY